jgi:hypothetical protein
MNLRIFIIFLTNAFISNIYHFLLFLRFFKRFFSLFFLLILYFSLTVFNLYSENFRVGSYKYYKKIKIESIIEKSNSFGSIQFDEDLQIHSNHRDIRILQNNNLVPFVIRESSTTDSNEDGKKSVKLISKSETEEKITYILELEPLDKSLLYDSLSLTSPESFESEATVYTSIDQKTWIHQSTQSLHKYNQTNESLNQDKIILNLSTPFLKLEFSPKIPLTFKESFIHFKPAKKIRENSFTLQQEDIIKINSLEEGTSIYKVENKRERPFEKFQIFFKEEEYSRKLDFYVWNSTDKEYKFEKSFSLIKNKNEVNYPFYYLNTSNYSNYRLDIIDNENKPLTLEKIVHYKNEEEIIFPLENLSSDDLFIYYGNEYAKNPIFDNSTFSSLNSDSIIIQSFTITKQEVNQDFSYTFSEPPMSSWIIRVTFILGMIFSFFLLGNFLKNQLN